MEGLDYREIRWLGCRYKRSKRTHTDVATAAAETVGVRVGFNFNFRVGCCG